MLMRFRRDAISISRKQLIASSCEWEPFPRILFSEKGVTLEAPRDLQRSPQIPEMCSLLTISSVREHFGTCSIYPQQQRNKIRTKSYFLLCFRSQKEVMAIAPRKGAKRETPKKICAEIERIFTNRDFNEAFEYKQGQAGVSRSRSDFCFQFEIYLQEM